jgi:hypothetical protein
MKRNIELIALLCVAFLILPQLSFGMDMSIGLKAGIGHNTFFGDDYEQYKDRADSEADLEFARSVFKFSLTAGAFVTIGLMEHLALQPEVHFFMGGDAHGDDETVRSVNINFLEIPVLAKGRMNLGPGTFTVFAGPYFSIKLGSGILVYDEVGGGDRVERELDSGDVTSFLLGLVGGIGYDWPLGPGFLTTDIRYRWGLTNVHSDDFISNNDVKERGILLTVGYGFTIIKGP